MILFTDVRDPLSFFSFVPFCFLAACTFQFQLLFYDPYVFCLLRVEKEWVEWKKELVVEKRDI